MTEEWRRLVEETIRRELDERDRQMESLLVEAMMLQDFERLDHLHSWTRSDDHSTFGVGSAWPLASSVDDWLAGTWPEHRVVE